MTCVPIVAMMSPHTASLGELHPTGVEPAPLIASQAMNRNTLGVILLIGAFALGVAGMITWSNETEAAESQTRVNQYADAMRGVPDRPAVEAERTAPFALWAIAGLATICGTIVLATAPRSSDDATPSAPS